MPDTPLKRLYDRGLWIKAGSAALFLIRERTLRGEFLPGSTKDGYSTTPMPVFGLDKLGKGVQGKIARLVKAGEDKPESAEAYYRTTKLGKKWLILKGGYKALRELAGKPVDKVTLTWRGATLRNLKVRPMPGGGAGFNLEMSDPELAKIADFHNRLGAGKAKKIRRFIGFTPEEVGKVVDVFAGHLP